MSTLRSAKDFFTEESEGALAATIRGYWEKRGYSPSVVVHDKVYYTDERGRVCHIRICVVRSDMINGRPR